MAGLAALLCTLFGGCAFAPARALAPALAHVPASTTATNPHELVSIIQDDPQLLRNPAATLLRFRQLGAQQVRVAVRWYYIAPDPNSFRAPARFNAANPASYSNAGWAPYDAIVRDATADGIEVNFNVVGGAPLWATGGGMPKLAKSQGYPFYQWEPSSFAFWQFMQALGTRYSGNYNPQARRIERDNRNDLPRVSFWSIWNEPDYGPSLAPQALPGHPGVPDSPRMYRGLVDAAWSALRLTGHGSDGFLFGELAPRATPQAFGDFNGMLPTTFVQSLYCLGSNYQPLRGTAAALQGCPTTAAGTRAFVAQNPGLFKATGFSDHAYMRWFPPNDEQNFNSGAVPVPYPSNVWAQLVRGFTSLGTIGNLSSMLKRSLAAYGWHKQLMIWNTEFGYITSPPKKPNKVNADPYIPPATAAYYDNWAEYLSWKNPQMASFEQYLMEDPLPALQSNNYGGFASGLLFYGGRQKAGYAAWRLPIFLPNTTASSPRRPLEVWGDVRPAYYADVDNPYSSVQSAELLFEPHSHGRWILLEAVTVTNPDGYFEVPVRFPSSGTLIIRWYYPADDKLFGSAAGAAVFSRPVQVTVK